MRRPIQRPRPAVLAAIALSLSWLAIPPADATGPVISGSVIDAQGAPLAGARIVLAPAADRYPLTALLVAGQPGPAPIADATTDADGAFRLVAPAIGMYRAEVTAPGHVPAQIRLRPLLDDIALDSAWLGRDVGLVVTLHDPAGQPLADVPVVAYRSAPSSRKTTSVGFDLPMPLWHGAPALARTDDTGTVRLAAAEGETLWIQATPVGYPQLLEKVEAKAGSVTLSATQAPVGRLVVRDVRGRPIPDVFVYADRQPLPIARTDARGEAPFAILLGRPTRLDLASAEGDWGTFTMSAEEDRPDGLAELVLQPARRVDGQVRTQGSDRPLAGALVWPRGAPGRATTADRSGGFDLSISAEEERLIAVAGGYRPDIRHIDLSDDRDLPSMTLRPRAVCAATGTVRDPDGVALAGVQMLVVPESAPTPRPTGDWPWMTERDGSFRLDRLLCGESHRLRLRRNGFVTAERRLPAIDAGDTVEGLDVVLEHGRRAAGRVVDESEQPVAGATVELVPITPANRRFRRHEPLSVDFTAEDGQFTLVDLPDGRFNLRVVADGFAAAMIPGVAIEDAPHTDLGTVILDTGVALTGRVVDDRDRPVAAAEVHVIGGGLGHARRPTSRQAITDDDGRFSIPGFQRDVRVGVKGHADGYVGRRLDAVLPGDEPIRLQLMRAATVSGRVVDGSGWPIEGVSIGVGYPGNPDAMSFDQVADRTDNLGRFQLPGVVPGAAQLDVRAPEHQNREITITVPEPGAPSQDVEVVLEAGAGLDGVVLTAKGEPVDEAWVVLLDDRGSQAPTATDGTGRFRLRGLVPGTYRLQASHDIHGTVEQPHTVETGERFVELRFPDGHQVRGTVIDDGGQPIGGAEIFAVAERGQVSHTESDAEGRFALPPMSPGRYHLSARATGYLHFSQTIDVEAGASATTDIVLARGATIRGQVTGLSIDELSRVSFIVTETSTLTGRVIDFEGRFEIPGVGPGTHQVIAQTHDSGRQATATVEVVDASPIEGVILEFVEGYRVTGSVVLADRPGTGLQINLRAEEDPILSLQTRTSPSGRFRFADVPAGRYIVSIFGNDGILGHRSVDVSTDLDVPIELRGSRLSGRVLDPAGRPITRIRPLLQHDDPDTGTHLARHAGTDANGYFVIEALPPGTWRLTVDAPGWQPYRRTVEIPPEGEQTIQIVMVAAGTDNEAAEDGAGPGG